MYQITRRALNEAWSGRTAKVGRPHKTLAAALAYAMAHADQGLTITDTESGLWGKVGRFMYGSRQMTEKPTLGARISLEFPEQWAALVSVDGVSLTAPERDALNTLCELELGTGQSNRIEAWRHLETAQDKLLARLD